MMLLQLLLTGMAHRRSSTDTCALPRAQCGSTSAAPRNSCSPCSRWVLRRRPCAGLSAPTMLMLLQLLPAQRICRWHCRCPRRRSARSSLCVGRTFACHPSLSPLTTTCWPASAARSPFIALPGVTLRHPIRRRRAVGVARGAIMARAPGSTQAPLLVPPPMVHRLMRAAVTMRCSATTVATMARPLTKRRRRRRRRHAVTIRRAQRPPRMRNSMGRSQQHHRRRRAS